MTTSAVVSQVVEAVVEQPGQSQAPLTENVLTLADPIG
jgi:hypothetical protein